MSLIDLVYAFESATRAHENIGSQPLEDHAIIEEEFKSAKENLIVEIKERTNDPALAVIQYILSDNVDGTDDAMEFLNYWNEGEFDILRRNWNNIPDEVFIGGLAEECPAVSCAWFQLLDCAYLMGDMYT